MSAENTVISIKKLRKEFKLPHQKISSVKGLFTNIFALGGNQYESQVALRDINIDIKEGEFFGIVGRNGSGKSTLLKIIAGIYNPTKGSVKINGRLVPFIELGVGFNPELTGRENVYLNGAMLGFARTEIKSKYDKIVEFAELERFMDQKLKNYSSGMQVRLAFACATILAESDILLIDEVLAVGDADFQRKCFNYFKKLKKEKKTIVFVSHDMNAVREYCDRAVLIEDSRIIKQGKVAEVASAYTKMFMKENENSSTEDKIRKKRWGNNDLKIEKVLVTPSSVKQRDKKIKIEASFKVNKTTRNPVFGFVVKNAAGTNMLGTNTKLWGIDTGAFEEGKTKTVTWTFDNMLNDGDYTIDVAAHDSESAQEYDWWEDAVGFSVFREIHADYVVEPTFTTDIRH